MKDGKLVIDKTPNGESPLVKGATPILGCDVWEHSQRPSEVSRGVLGSIPRTSPRFRGEVFLCPADGMRALDF